MDHEISYPEKKCPGCGNDNLLDGPRGGLSQNVLCPECQREWNYGPFGYEEISPARTYLYRVVSPKLDLRIIPVGCKPGCCGETYPCIDEVAMIIEQGNLAFMIHGEHVKEQLEKLEYRIDVTSHNNIPIGMYISEKGSKSVYERF